MFDHLAIGALTLEDGLRAVRACLGVDLPAVGAHPQMGTHNRLMSLGRDRYLEILAVDPHAPPPARPRWFALSDADQRRPLAVAPRPIAWIARTRDLEAVLAAARSAGLDLGRPVDMTRGTLRWRIGIRDDGLLPEGGTLPLIIEWPDGPHPAQRMVDFGFRLAALRLRHPNPPALRSLLRAIGADGLAALEEALDGEPGIGCDLVTPDGGTRSL